MRKPAVLLLALLLLGCPGGQPPQPPPEENNTGGAQAAGLAGYSYRQLANLDEPIKCALSDGIGNESFTADLWLKGSLFKYVANAPLAEGGRAHITVIAKGGSFYSRVSEESKAAYSHGGIIDFKDCAWLSFPSESPVEGVAPFARSAPLGLEARPASDFSCWRSGFGMEEFELAGRVCDYKGLYDEAIASILSGTPRVNCSQISDLKLRIQCEALSGG